MDREKTVAEPNVPSLTPPKNVLDDEWSQWLIGTWGTAAESDLGQFKNWVKGRGHMRVEPGLGGQFLIRKMDGHATEVSDEYMRYLSQTQHTPEAEIEKLRNLPFENIELHTFDPTTGRIVAYLFDSWRCVARGTGTRDGDRETIEWEWSVAGRGTSVRITNRVGEDRLAVTERYTLPDGVVMEDRVQMTRVR
ncbi:MAG: hypothetical protein JXB13_13995 [Phycisphaerae bacterium]|nr:hypothetical protein [Phycisphaerae bacterium]